MKLKNIFLGLITVGIAFAGCDEISQPLIPKQVNSKLPTTPPTDTTNNDASYQTYKVLLEDCMGDQCSNCPSAVAVGDTLISTYSNPTLAPHIILVEDNMGNFAVPGPSSGYPSYAFSTDYRCVAGNNWCTTFFNPIGYPAGYINRIGYNGTVVLNINANNWQDTIQNELLPQYPSTPPVEIRIHDSCYVPQRLIGVHFKVTFMQTLPAGTYFLLPEIVEDPIVSWQKDDLFPIGYDSTFVHHFVLRGTFDLNGIGTQITTPATADSTFTSFQTYDFTKGENGKAATWNMANCYIVVFVYNQATHRVYQTERVKIE